MEELCDNDSRRGASATWAINIFHKALGVVRLLSTCTGLLRGPCENVVLSLLSIIVTLFLDEPWTPPQMPSHHHYWWLIILKENTNVPILLASDFPWRQTRMRAASLQSYLSPAFLGGDVDLMFFGSPRKMC
jgi:hypothetical protein